MSTINYHIDPKIRMKQMVYHAQRTAKEFESTGDYQKAKMHWTAAERGRAKIEWEPLPPSQLERMANRINYLHGITVCPERDKSAIECGRLLVEVWSILHKERSCAWFDAYCRFPRETANLYVTLWQEHIKQARQ